MFITQGGVANTEATLNFSANSLGLHRELRRVY
jgi:hypothetical protein